MSARFLSWEGVFQDLMRPKRWKGKVSRGASFEPPGRLWEATLVRAKYQPVPSLYGRTPPVCAKVRRAYVHRTCTRVGQALAVFNSNRTNRTTDRCWLGIRIINYII